MYGRLPFAGPAFHLAQRVPPAREVDPHPVGMADRRRFGPFAGRHLLGDRQAGIPAGRSAWIEVCALIVEAAGKGLAGHPAHGSLERPGGDPLERILLDRRASIRQQRRPLRDVGAGRPPRPKRALLIRTGVALRRCWSRRAACPLASSFERSIPGPSSNTRPIAAKGSRATPILPARGRRRQTQPGRPVIPGSGS